MPSKSRRTLRVLLFIRLLIVTSFLFVLRGVASRPILFIYLLSTSFPPRLSSSLRSLISLVLFSCISPLPTPRSSGLLPTYNASHLGAVRLPHWGLTSGKLKLHSSLTFSESPNSLGYGSQGRRAQLKPPDFSPAFDSYFYLVSPPDLIVYQT